MNNPVALMPKSQTGLTPYPDSPPPPRESKVMTFLEWDKMKGDWIDKDNQSEQWQRWRKWQECLKFFVGEQLIWWNGSTESGHWKNADIEEGDPYYASNIFQPYLNALIAELFRSRPKLMVTAKTNQWRDIEAATVARHATEQEMRRLWTDEQILRYLFFFVVYGNAFLYTGWIPDKGPLVKIPQYGQEDVNIDSRFAVCPSCGIEQPMSPNGVLSSAMAQTGMPPSTPGMPVSPQMQMPQMPGMQGMPQDPMQAMQGQMQAQDPMAGLPPMCPKCQRPMQIMGDQSQMQMPSYQGDKEQKGGDTQLFIPDPTQIKLHLSSRWLGESPYLDLNMWMLKDQAEMIYGDDREYHTPTGKQYDAQRGILRQNESMPGNVSGMGAFGSHESGYKYMGNDSELVMVKQSWRRPCLYWNVILKEPFRVKEGLELPAGVPLQELYPEGMVVTKNGDQVLDIDAKVIEKHWTHARYQVIPTKIWGDGVGEQLIQPQREYNEMRSIEAENACYNATPPVIVNPKKIKPTSVSGKARQVISMENSAKGDDNPANYFFTPPGRQMGGDLPNFRQNIKGDMQLNSGAPVGESGIPGSGNDTATGMQIIKDWTNSKLAIRIGPLNSALISQAQQNLKLIQENWVGQRFVKISNEVGLDDGKWFEGADIRGDFDISVRPGSDRPTSSMEMKDNILQMLVAGGVPFGVFNQAFPRPAAVILTRELGMPMDLDGYSMHARKQRDEIEAIKSEIQTAQQFPPNMPMNPMMQDPMMMQGQQQQGMMPPQDPSMQGMQGMEAPIPPEAGMETGTEQPQQPQMPIDPMMQMQMAQQMQQQMIMQQVAMAVPVEETDDDQAHIETIKYYANTDIGRKEAPEVKAAIIQHMHMHEQAMAMKQMQQMMMATANGMMPMQQPPGGMQANGQSGQPPMQGGGQPPQKQMGQGGGQSKPSPKPSRE